jgi:hypothetical protein
MRKTGSESPYILCLGALSALFCSRLKPREKESRIHCGYHRLGGQNPPPKKKKKKILARKKLQYFSPYSDRRLC